MELFDRIVTIATILFIFWLFVRNPGEFVREWIIRPFWGAETADRMAARAQDARTPAQDAARQTRTQDTPQTRTQDAAPVYDEQARIDCAARALAANLAGEAAIIELLFDGVTRGGGARYITLRDAVRERAAAYGVRLPERSRTITISNKREIEL